ncbi:hypothetical protein P9112_010929 [Eukaryota sp. TZLM1-RC]
MSSTKPKAAVLVYDGVEELECISVVDFLRRADVDVVMLKCYCKEFVVTGLHKLGFRADECFNGEITSKTFFDLIVVPGGRQMEFLKCSDSMDLIKHQHANDKLLAICCTALESVGKKSSIFTNKKVVDHPKLRELRIEGVEYVTDNVVVDGNLITALGLSSVFDLSRQCISMLKGEAVAKDLFDNML